MTEIESLEQKICIVSSCAKLERETLNHTEEYLNELLNKLEQLKREESENVGRTEIDG